MILKAFEDILGRNKNERLTDFKMRFVLETAVNSDIIGPIDLHIHHGRLVGVEDVKGLVRYEVLEDFPAEFRPIIQEILVKLNRNAQNAMKVKLREEIRQKLDPWVR